MWAGGWREGSQYLNTDQELTFALYYFIPQNNDLYSSPNIGRVMKSRRIRRAGHVARMGERRSVYRVLVEKPEGKRQLGRPRRRWEDNINLLKPNDLYICHTSALTSRRYILNIYSTNIHTEYFKHAA